MYYYRIKYQFHITTNAQNNYLLFHFLFPISIISIAISRVAVTAIAISIPSITMVRICRSFLASPQKRGVGVVGVGVGHGVVGGVWGGIGRPLHSSVHETVGQGKSGQQKKSLEDNLHSSESSYPELTEDSPC